MGVLEVAPKLWTVACTGLVSCGSPSPWMSQQQLLLYRWGTVQQCLLLWVLVVVMTIDHLSGKVCWCTLRNEPMEFTPTNAMGFYSVKAIGNPWLPPALMSSKVKPSQSPPHSRLLGTVVAPAPFLCFWLYPDISFPSLQITCLYEVVLCFSLHCVAAGSEWSLEPSQGYLHV